MSTTRTSPPPLRSRDDLLRRPLPERTEDHDPEYLDRLRVLASSARGIIHALNADATDADSLARAVRYYIGCAVRAEISRTRIHDALELLVHEHGGARWFGSASALASLAFRVSVPRYEHDQPECRLRIA